MEGYMTTLECHGINQSVKLYNVIPSKTGIAEELVLYLEKCKVCGHPVIEIRRTDIWGNIQEPVRLKVKNIEKFRENMIVLWEPNSLNEGNQQGGFYLHCSEYGTKTKCYSNLSTLKPRPEYDEGPDQRFYKNHIAA